MNVCTYVCMSAYVHAWVELYVYVCMYVRTYVFMYVCMHACMCVCRDVVLMFRKLDHWHSDPASRNCESPIQCQTNATSSSSSDKWHGADNSDESYDSPETTILQTRGNQQIATRRRGYRMCRPMPSKRLCRAVGSGRSAAKRCSEPDSPATRAGRSCLGRLRWFGSSKV